MTGDGRLGETTDGGRRVLSVPAGCFSQKAAMNTIPISMMTRFEMLQAALFSIAAYAGVPPYTRPGRQRLLRKLSEIQSLAERVLDEVSDCVQECAQIASPGKPFHAQ